MFEEHSVNLVFLASFWVLFRGVSAKLHFSSCAWQLVLLGVLQVALYHEYHLWWWRLKPNQNYRSQHKARTIQCRLLNDPLVGCCQANPKGLILRKSVISLKVSSQSVQTCMLSIVPHSSTWPVQHEVSDAFYSAWKCFGKMFVFYSFDKNALERLYSHSCLICLSLEDIFFEQVKNTLYDTLNTNSLLCCQHYYLELPATF